MKILTIIMLSLSVLSMALLLLAFIGGRISNNRELRAHKKQADLRRDIDARNTAMPVDGRYTNLKA